MILRHYRWLFFYFDCCDNVIKMLISQQFSFCLETVHCNFVTC